MGKKKPLGKTRTQCKKESNGKKYIGKQIQKKKLLEKKT